MTRLAAFIPPRQGRKSRLGQSRRASRPRFEGGHPARMGGDAVSTAVPRPIRPSKCFSRRRRPGAAGAARSRRPRRGPGRRADLGLPARLRFTGRAWRGAPHTLDIPLVFGTLDAPGSIAGTGAASRAVSDAMMKAFIALARTGGPGWPPISYSADRGDDDLRPAAARREGSAPCRARAVRARPVHPAGDLAPRHPFGCWMTSARSPG